MPVMYPSVFPADPIPFGVLSVPAGAGGPIGQAKELPRQAVSLRAVYSACLGAAVHFDYLWRVLNKFVYQTFQSSFCVSIQSILKIINLIHYLNNRRGTCCCLGALRSRRIVPKTHLPFEGKLATELSWLRSIRLGYLRRTPLLIRRCFSWLKELEHLKRERMSQTLPTWQLAPH